MDSNTIKLSGESGETSIMTNSELKPTHVAFGKKVAIPDHILSSRQQQQVSYIYSEHTGMEWLYSVE